MQSKYACSRFLRILGVNKHAQSYFWYKNTVESQSQISGDRHDGLDWTCCVTGGAACGIHVHVPYHTILYHTIPYHTMPYHTMPAVRSMLHATMVSECSSNASREAAARIRTTGQGSLNRVPSTEGRRDNLTGKYAHVCQHGTACYGRAVVEQVIPG